MSATGGSANSQSASEQGESAKRERALRTRLASSGGQLTKRTEQGARRAQARATCSGSEALVLTAENRQIFQDISRRELSANAQQNSAALPSSQRGTFCRLGRHPQTDQKKKGLRDTEGLLFSENEGSKKRRSALPVRQEANLRDRWKRMEPSELPKVTSAMNST